MKEQIPQAVGVGLAGGLPLVPGAYTAAGQRIGAAIQGAKHGDKLIQSGKALGQALDGALVPVSPVAPSIPGALGLGTKQAYDYAKKKKEEK